VQLADPADRGRLTAQDPPVGERVQVRLTGASVLERTVAFTLA